MTHRRQISAAAALSVLAVLALLIYLYRYTIADALLCMAGARVAWAVAKAKLGIKPRKRGKSLWEVLAALLGGFLLGRHQADTHPCVQCGHPIGKPSRAVYCSPACRNYARLERAETERRGGADFGTVPF